MKREKEALAEKKMRSSSSVIPSFRKNKKRTEKSRLSIGKMGSREKLTEKESTTERLVYGS
jgi:hypothetical protein